LDESARSFLLKANSEATWFLNQPGPPEYLLAFPGGVELWKTLYDIYPCLKPVSPALVHIDYWSGNILWNEGEISAVLDWEEAACGDPVIDVAYARMNIVLMGLPETAEEFLAVYEAETGRKAGNLGLWELAAAVRPISAPVDWELDRPEIHARLLEFIEAAKRRAESSYGQT
jgi:Ser/Thr protein kinase RdoA (MazF antagonist)